ncbi:MAG: 30S ribosomal protein S12 methylthiotransferase RimO [Proteocatella sp.]|nr:30S ribosomal protein S12 methylthiotransferase RimO [Proteocatella sp.]MBP7908144.1 30S ribosomal protein S12 methylthiotransferase RimO [Proteocatella sp.]MBP9658792.1 30S ribosomal protein S12 methylthiotransferase RimO [Proteocatella sp.]NCB70734.1 30S ribosomal protein S12 methylthiotransferase RimO [Clostridia bacterium]
MEKIFISTLGCAKNLVDSEMMLGTLVKNDYVQTGSIMDADIAIVNTCGFIEAAKEESINEILELAQYKERGNLKYLIVTGCLAQRYSDELLSEIPEIDIVLGTTSFDMILEKIEELKGGIRSSLITDIDKHIAEEIPRSLLTDTFSAYIKIAEGCDNHCTYCIIPKLRGKYRSRRQEDILKEARQLAKNGVKELIVIAQDTTKYGLDIYGKKAISDLMRELNEIEGLKWIRILYSYPEDVDAEFVKAVKECEKVLPYFDMPVQHANDAILKLMNRKTSKQQIKENIDRIRKEIPEASIRTSIIVGFPTETQEQFDELCEFVKEVKFDRLGVFAYSREEDTPAAILEGQIDEDIKQERKNRLMEIQQGISYEKNKTFVESTLEVMIDEKVEDGLYEGRSYRDMMEIDGLVFVKTQEDLKKGQFVNVNITEALEYDLTGELI